ncbi:MAG: hypothetical protein SGPRY_013894, partial [Prymnesium sp.]
PISPGLPALSAQESCSPAGEGVAPATLASAPSSWPAIAWTTRMRKLQLEQFQPIALGREWRHVGSLRYMRASRIGKTLSLADGSHLQLLSDMISKRGLALSGGASEREANGSRERFPRLQDVRKQGGRVVVANNELAIHPHQHLMTSHAPRWLRVTQIALVALAGLTRWWDFGVRAYISSTNVWLRLARHVRLEHALSSLSAAEGDAVSLVAPPGDQILLRAVHLGCSVYSPQNEQCLKVRERGRLRHVGAANRQSGRFMSVGEGRECPCLRTSGGNLCGNILVAQQLIDDLRRSHHTHPDFRSSNTHRLRHNRPVYLHSKAGNWF